MATAIQVKSALHYHARPNATHWDLNLYRGCSHRCQYCYAQYSHHYLGSDRFFDEIFVKTNIAGQLDKEFSRRRWQKAPVTLSGISDCYQPLEKKYQLMPKVLQVFIKHANPIVISTKSLLIERDKSLIRELAQTTDVFITTSISTLDRDLAKKLEPNAPPPAMRLEMLARFKKMGCTTTLLYMPIIPYLTDKQDQFVAVFETFKTFDFDNLYAGMLNLRGQTRQIFLYFVRENFADTLYSLYSLYQDPHRLKAYRYQLNAKLSSLRTLYKITNRYLPNLDPLGESEQLDLFQAGS